MPNKALVFIVMVFAILASAQIINIDKIDTLPCYKKAKWDDNILTVCRMAFAIFIKPGSIIF